MVKVLRQMLATGTAFLLSACWGHSFPDTTSFIGPVRDQVAPAETVEVFVDSNGTFYPSGWEEELGRPRSWKADSLLNESNDDPEFRRLIETGERDQLDQMTRFGRDRDRIFILVHGYNNTQAEALEAYRMIEAKLDARPGDGIVRFYWDGLTGTGVGGAGIWFSAAGYSQLAGSRGLRRVLESFSGREIYLISHSRGASVVLSAIGNPVYDPGFLAATLGVASTWGGEYRALTAPPALEVKGNSLHILALAPAVDRIDFCDVSQQPEQSGRFRCDRLRELGPVASFRYTVNPDDPILNKFVGQSGGFNPTGLGTDPSVGRELAETYGFLRPYRLTGDSRYHSFTRYVESSAFNEMLKDAGLLRAAR